ncbi:aldo/keto reductase [Nitrospinota bacterium]
MPHAGYATPEGTASFKDAFAGKVDQTFFRPLGGLWMSSVGIGTYLGEADAETDAAYSASIVEAIGRGCNVIDSAINYRFQHSERSIARALDDMFAEDAVRREQLVLATKGGFIPFDGAPPADAEAWMEYMKRTFFDIGCCTPSDIVANCHCMTPAYIRHELEASLSNLGVETIDIYYVHNPETQLQEVPREAFLERLQAAFAELEKAVEEGKIRSYGAATWNGFRADLGEKEYLSLEEVVGAAVAAGGDGHHFRTVQLPLNLGMSEAFAKPNQQVRGETVSFLAAAAQLDITVMTSGSILQGQAARNLPHVVSEAFPDFETDGQRAIQFTRSAPGVGVALVGMRQKSHVEENLAVAERPPATFDQFMKLFRVDES